MSVIRSGAILVALTTGIAVAQPSPPAPPPPPQVFFPPSIIGMDGAYTWGSGATRPTLGIDRAQLSWAMTQFYPPGSVRAHEEGTTTVVACVTERGIVAKTALAQSSGYQRLDEAALAMMAAIPMKPSTLNGKPVAFCGYQLSVSWVLPEDLPEEPLPKP